MQAFILGAPKNRFAPLENVYHGNLPGVLASFNESGSG